MNQIIMNISASSDSFGAYSENCEGIYAAGDTIEECQKDVETAIELIKKNLPEECWPEPIKGEYELCWHYDERSVPQPESSTLRQKLQDIYLAVSWREVSRTYFDKSVSWFYHKMQGIDGNGGQGEFTREEALQLKGALVDLSDRIRRCADSI